LPRDTSEALEYTAGELERQHRVIVGAAREVADTVLALQHVGQLRLQGGGFILTLSSPKLFAGSSVVLDGDSPDLDAVAHAIAAAVPGALVTIESHFEMAVASKSDAAIAERRADAVVSYLAEHGLAREHLVVAAPSTRHTSAQMIDQRIEIVVSPAVGL
jgi:outer membrane protein OmpA-like peptidoglycan-associated protein